MKVWVVSKNEEDNPGAWRSGPKVAVVLQRPDSRPKGYYVDELRLIVSTAQLDAMQAFREVCCLSNEARAELRITLEVIDEIGKRTDPPATAAPGDTLYATLFRHPDHPNPNELQEIYSYPPPAAEYMVTVPLKVYNTLGDYLAVEPSAKVVKEIERLSPATRKILAMTVR